MGLFATGILVITWNNQRFKFGSFGNRDIAYDRMVALWAGIVAPSKQRENSINMVGHQSDDDNMSIGNNTFEDIQDIEKNKSIIDSAQPEEDKDKDYPSQDDEEDD